MNLQDLRDATDILGPFASRLGLTWVRADADGLEVTWEATEPMHQPYGIVHGGVHCTVVETLGSVGAALWYAERGKVVGVSNTTEFFRAVTTGPMRSVATPTHRGRSQQVWDVVTRDDEGRLVARGSLRIQNIPRS